MKHLGQIILTTAGGLAFALLVLWLARRGRLSMRYTLGWFFVAGCVVVGGVFGWLVDPIAELLGVDPTTIELAGAMAGLLAITVQLSITVSGLTELVRTLAESSALLEERIARLERDRSANRAGAGPTESVEQGAQRFEDHRHVH